MELLCPSGNKESLIAAINSGANAVYLSGKKFGARAFAANFSNEELKEAKRAIKLLGGEIIKQEKLKLDNEKMERNLIIIKKVSTTAKKYPRKPGMPAKQPL